MSTDPGWVVSRAGGSVTAAASARAAEPTPLATVTITIVSTSEGQAKVKADFRDGDMSATTKLAVWKAAAAAVSDAARYL